MRHGNCVIVGLCPLRQSRRHWVAYANCHSCTGSPRGGSVMVGSFKMFLVRKINALRTASPRRTILQVMQMEGRLTPAVLGDQPLDARMSDVTQVSTLPEEGTGQTAGTTTDTVA